MRRHPINIFHLDDDPTTCARYHCDKHVVKMVLESAQILSTAMTILGVEDAPYRPTHSKHPCVVWAAEGRGNFVSVLDLMKALCSEYTHRYGKVHKCQSLIPVFEDSAQAIRELKKTTQPQCMPDIYRVPGDPVAAYRAYYVGEKTGFARWTGRQIPEWFMVYRNDSMAGLLGRSND